MAIANALDQAWSARTTSASVISSAFSPSSGTLIIIEYEQDAINSVGATSLTPSDSVGLSWNAIGTAQGASSGAIIHAWWAYTADPQDGMTVTVTASGSDQAASKTIRVTTWAGAATASSVVSKAQGSSATNNLTVNVSNTNDGCRIAGFALDWNALGLPASADSYQAYHSAGLISGIGAFKSSNTSGTGQSVGLNFDGAGSSSPDWAYKVYEIVPGAGDSSPSAGIGSDTDAAYAPTVSVGASAGFGDDGDACYNAIVDVTVSAEASLDTDVAFDAPIPQSFLSLFTTQTPTGTNENDGSDITLGIWIKSSVAGTVHGIRWYGPLTVPSSAPIGLLYDEAGTELARVTFGTIAPGDWNEAFFSSPVPVAADTFYLAAIYTPDRYVGTGGFFNIGGEGESGISNGSLSSPVTGGGPTGHTANGLFVEPSGGDATFPTDTFNGGCYFTDILFLAGTGPAPDAALDSDSAYDAVAAISPPAETASDTDEAYAPESSTPGQFTAVEASDSDETFFEAGTSISLTLIGDNPIEDFDAAYDATIGSGLQVGSGTASDSDTANGAVVRISPSAGSADDSDAAYNATIMVSNGGTTPVANVSSDTDSSHNPSVAIERETVTAEDSDAAYDATILALSPGVLTPIRVLTPSEILTGNRNTRFYLDLLDLNDAPFARLGGVQDGRLEWIANAAIKGAGELTVTDVSQQINWLTVRLRPVMVIEGLPIQPLGVYLPSEAPESWDLGRTWSIKLLDKTTILDQDSVSQTYALAAGSVVTDEIVTLIESAGITNHSITPSAATLPGDIIWLAGTKKLRIVNDLLAIINYFSLYSNFDGQLRGEPYTLPAQRPLYYEFIDGTSSIYEPRFGRDNDIWNIPNRVTVSSMGDGVSAALTSTYDNTNPDSPYSIANRGRVIGYEETGVEIADQAALDAYAQRVLVNKTTPTVGVEITHSPVPGLTVNQAARFRRIPAGIDARHTVSKTSLTLHGEALATTILREVVDV